MTDSYFHAHPDGFKPEFRAHGPWAEDMMHGRLIGGLAARALEAEFGGPGWRAARLTVDLFRPAAMAPIQIATKVVRNGRKVRVADAVATCDGHEVGRTTGLFLVEGDEPPGRIWQPTPTTWPYPETLPAPADETGAAEHDGWLFRTVEGGMGTGERSRVWTNDTIALVDDEPLSPLVRAAVSGDIACPLANSGSEGIHYINADYTMLLARYPIGDWVGLEVAQQIQADGIAIASATLVDRQGPFATSSGASLARPPLQAEG
ncbi:MAG: thioesterase family protein [Acidimicrobiales bacterium]